MRRVASGSSRQISVVAICCTLLLGSSSAAGQSTCVPDDHTLCLLDGRFSVNVDFAPPGGSRRPANATALTDRAGVFWFFNENNIEMLIKMQNACIDPFNHFWVFFAATTNVEFEVVVEDTAHLGVERHYTNPQGMAARPVLDTGAFATCP